MQHLPSRSNLVPIARFIGIIAPTLYAGITAQCFTLSDSITFVLPIISHAPNQKIMAKQWFQGYQYGPLWVPPLIIPGTICNAYLAYIASSASERNVYAAAVIAIFSIAPITFLYMEPGINGACKWKVQELLKDEGFKLSETKVWAPSAWKHGGTIVSRRWAEKTSMKDLILFWQKVNNWRVVAGVLAACLSGWAAFMKVGRE